MQRRRRVVALVLALVTGCLAACTSPSPRGTPTTGAPSTPHGAPATVAASTDGTVAGTLRLVGGPLEGSNRPAPGEVYVFRTEDLAGSPVARAAAGSDGGFTISIPPGTYYLAATSPTFTTDPRPATPPCHAGSPVVVVAGSTTRADVLCEMR